jgi:hypothetical protein
MASYNKVNSFVGNLVNAQVNLGSDTLKCALTNTSPLATWTGYTANVASVELASGGGYTTGGATVPTVTDTDTSGTVTLSAGNVVFTASGSMGPFRYAVLYDSTASGGPILGWYDYGSSISLTTSGETFTVSFPSGIFTLA